MRACARRKPHAVLDPAWNIEHFYCGAARLVPACYVAVRGWGDLSGAARTKLIAELSDHSSLYAEVE